MLVKTRIKISSSKAYYFLLPGLGCSVVQTDRSVRIGKQVVTASFDIVTHLIAETKI